MAVAGSEGAQRVLVVDDDEPLAKVMARTLRSRGFECDVAYTGAEARALVAKHEYAVALLDVKLPDESGYGLLEELRSMKKSTRAMPATSTAWKGWSSTPRPRCDGRPSFRRA